MRAPLPSLASLRSFEASARLESFSKAALELNLTQAAISQQVKLLEGRVGGALFIRDARRVRLTELGKLYMSLTSEALRQMEGAFETARALARPNALIIKTTPTFAAYWLLPRLPAFQALWPDAKLTITSFEPSLGPLDGLGDVAITTSRDEGQGFVSQKLFDTDLVPVASAAVVQRIDLGRFLANRLDTIIHTIRRLDDWPLWCRGAGVPSFSLDRGTVLFNSALSYAAAEKGMGIVIAEEVMIADQLAWGALAAVHSTRVPSLRSYFLLSPERRMRKPIVVAFIDWLHEEMNKTRGVLKSIRGLSR